MPQPSVRQAGLFSGSEHCSLPVIQEFRRPINTSSERPRPVVRRYAITRRRAVVRFPPSQCITVAFECCSQRDGRLAADVTLGDEALRRRCIRGSAPPPFRYPLRIPLPPRGGTKARAGRFCHNYRASRPWPRQTSSRRSASLAESVDCNVFLRCMLGVLGDVTHSSGMTGHQILGCGPGQRFELAHRLPGQTG